MIISLEQACENLIEGKPVAIPTETVYGLAAIFDDEDAVKDVYKHKNRPLDHPLILHISSKEWVNNYSINLPSYVDRLVNAFWPGPLTLVVHKSNLIPDYITAGQSTVAIRMPKHQLALDLIEKVGKPLIAPSANMFCKTSPTCAEHVITNFNARIPALDGGNCMLGIESTIILATNEDHTSLLRPGLISRQDIEQVTNVPCLDDKTKIKAPGKLSYHYKPSLPLYSFEKYSELKKLPLEIRSFYMVFSKIDGIENDDLYIMPNDPVKYAHMLYGLWQSVSSDVYDQVIIELPNFQDDHWDGVRDRIKKASTSIPNNIKLGITL